MGNGVKTVTGVEVPEPPKPLAPVDNPPARATTTSEENLHTKGQRTINLIWEITQALLALTVINTVLFVAGKLALSGVSPQATEKQISVAMTAFLLLSNLASLIIGFYFGRTNHQKIGGIQLGR